MLVKSLSSWWCAYPFLYSYLQITVVMCTCKHKRSPTFYENSSRLTMSNSHFALTVACAGGYCGCGEMLCAHGLRNWPRPRIQAQAARFAAAFTCCDATRKFSHEKDCGCGSNRSGVAELARSSIWLLNVDGVLFVCDWFEGACEGKGARLTWKESRRFWEFGFVGLKCSHMW